MTGLKTILRNYWLVVRAWISANFVAQGDLERLVNQMVDARIAELFEKSTLDAYCYVNGNTHYYVKSISANTTLYTTANGEQANNINDLVLSSNTITSLNKNTLVLNGNITCTRDLNKDLPLSNPEVYAVSDFEGTNAYCYTDGTKYYYTDGITPSANLYGTLTGVLANSLEDLFDISDDYTITSLTSDNGTLTDSEENTITITRSSLNDLGV